MRFGATTKLSLSATSLNDKPKLATLVGNIIATSAEVDLEVNLLLVHILGANALPAVAMLEVLLTASAHTRLKAHEEAAKAALRPAQFRVFRAVTKMAISSQADRHKIAHGVWASCPELPDALLVAEPQSLRWREIRRGRFYSDLATMLKGEWKPNSPYNAAELYDYDRSKIFIYSHTELYRILLGLMEAKNAAFYFRCYLQPVVRNRLAGKAPRHILKGLDTSAGALRRLSRLPRFRAALAALDASARKQKNTKPPRLPG
jgi:hypothetical protein